jgi:phosphomannomutase
VLELIRRRGQTLSSVLASFPRYSILKGEVPLETHRIPQMLHDLEKRYADGRRSAIDGLRIDYADRWFHVRVSQTEPIVRVICEQKGEAPKELFQELMQFVRSYNS